MRGVAPSRRLLATAVVLATSSGAFAQATAVLFPSDNSWIRPGVSRPPQGTTKKLVIGGQRLALIEFNLLPVLPIGTPIQRAILQMVALGSGASPPLSIFSILAPRSGSRSPVS